MVAQSSHNQWYPVSLISELTSDKPLARTILGEDIVVWRSGHKICAWKDLCIHRGVRLSLGTVCENRIRCAYHGWEYNSEGQCEVIPAHPNLKIPPKARASAVYSAHEYAGLIWVNLSEEPKTFPQLDQFSDNNYRVVPGGPYEIDAAAPRVVENFLDLSHVPILHDGSLGDSNFAEMSDYTIEDRPEGFFATDIRYFQPDPDGSGSSGDVWYDFGILAPFTVYFVKHIGSRQGAEKFVLMFAVRPESADKSWAYMVPAYNYAADLTEQQINDFHSYIFGQDRPVVESQRPELLPMDLSEELHLRSDQMTLRYRRYLKAIGMDFGVS